MVRECRPPARAPARSWLARRSTMATSTPANASSAANISPVGPPPAITTACSVIATLRPSPRRRPARLRATRTSTTTNASRDPRRFWFQTRRPVLPAAQVSPRLGNHACPPCYCPIKEDLGAVWQVSGRHLACARACRTRQNLTLNCPAAMQRSHLLIWSFAFDWVYLRPWRPPSAVPFTICHNPVRLTHYKL